MGSKIVSHVSSSELSTIVEHTAELADHAVSNRTRALYTAEFAQFARWTELHGLTPLPATPEIVCTYLGHMHATGRAVASAHLARAAIKWHHAHARLELDLTGADIRNVLKGYRRSMAGRQINKAEPFTVAMWSRLREIAGTSAADARDLALIGIGIVRALRGPSELLGLDLTLARAPDAKGSIQINPSGAVITLASTKTSQIDGETLEIEEGPALESLRQWVIKGQIAPGTPIWRTIRNGAVMTYRMKQRSMHDIIQRRAAQVLQADGMSTADAYANAQRYSTHSLRHGALTSIGQNKASLTEIMSLSRHSASSARIAMGYVKGENVGAKAIGKLGI